jgi:hypothetical protein
MFPRFKNIESLTFGDESYSLLSFCTLGAQRCSESVYSEMTFDPNLAGIPAQRE